MNIVRLQAIPVSEVLSDDYIMLVLAANLKKMNNVNKESEIQPSPVVLSTFTRRLDVISGLLRDPNTEPNIVTYNIAFVM